MPHTVLRARLRPTHNGNRTAANRELGYDRLGRLTQVTVGKGTPAQATTTYAYDAHDNLTRVTDADGRVTDYLYDDFGALIVVRSPDSGDTRYRYDAAGSLVEKLEADGKRTQYDYDARRRLVAERFDVVTGPHQQDRHFYYDGLAGSGATVGAQCATNDNVFDINAATLNTRLAWVTHGAGRTYYSYDGFGATVAVYEQPGATFDVCALAITRYGYDPLGRHTSTTYPTGRRVKYLYAAGALRPTTVQLVEPSQPSTPIVLASGITYDAQGEVTGYTAGAIDFAASFDLAGQATERTYAGATGHAFDWQVASRDGSGNILGLMDAATGKALTATYDGQDRLASALGEKLRGYQDCAWEYDGAGNRTSEACYDKSIEYTYEPGTNRLAALAWENDARACGEGLQVEQRAIARDAVGRATSGWKERFARTSDGYALAYGPDGRLATATVGLDQYAYAYDHRNLRLAKSGPATSQRTVFDERGSILAELEATTTREYVWLGGRAIAYLVDTDGTATTVADVHVLATDHLATPMRAYDPATGTTTWAADYEAFGDATEYMPGSVAPASIEVSLRFPGQQYDDETGLHYNWWREYGPAVGRYLQVDPLNLGTVMIEDGGGTASASEYVNRLLNPQIEQAFGYAVNSTLVFSDLDGRNPLVIPLGLCGLRPDVCQAAVQGIGAAAIVASAAIVAAVCAESTPKKNCPPCPPNPPAETDTDHSHYPCPGVHWHYRVYNQNPSTCECRLGKRLFGGCGPAPF